MKKSIKNDIIIYFSILIIAILSNEAFLHKHLFHDTIILLNYGYLKYATHFFFSDARIISALQCFLGYILHIEIYPYLFISTIIGIGISSLSVLLLYKFITKYLEIEKPLTKFLVLLSTYTIIFNHMSIEYLLYAESCVMNLGVLLNILAVIYYLKATKKHYLKSFMLLFLSTFCYQGIINIFPFLVISLICLKDSDFEFKKYIKEIFKTGLYFTLVLALNFLIITIFSTIFNLSNSRVNGFNIEQMTNVLHDLMNITKIVLTKQFDVLPKNLSIIVMLVTIIMLAIYSKNKLNILKYILIVLLAYALCLLPLIVYLYMTKRIFMAVGALMGISLLFIANQNLQEKISYKNIAIILFIILYFSFNIINIFYISNQYLEAFKIDDQEGKKICSIVQEYENTTGQKITKLAYKLSDNPHSYSKDIKEITVLTERKFCIHWTIEPTLKYYCNKDFEIVDFPEDIYKQYFNDNEFSEDQILCIDNTLYIFIY